MERLESKELLHEYFLLDLALVLIDSIDQVFLLSVFTFKQVCSRLRLLALLELSLTVLEWRREVLLEAAVGERRCLRSWRRQELNLEG